MTKIAVYNEVGEKINEMDLNSKIFGLPKVDPGLVHEAVRAQLANARKPYAHTKNRGEVSGSGKKPWKQKGTGRARAGSIRSPLWRGGGITFGPKKERNYTVRLNRSAFRKAVFIILTDKANNNRLVVVDDLKPVLKTKEIVAKLSNIAQKQGLGKKYLLIIPSFNKQFAQVLRNVKNIQVLAANELNVVDLLKNDILITKEALGVIEKTYLK